MTDTPDHIKKLQLELWLAKSPGERLLQFILDNDALMQGLDKVKLELGYSGKLSEQLNISDKVVKG